METDARNITRISCRHNSVAAGERKTYAMHVSGERMAGGGPCILVCHVNMTLPPAIACSARTHPRTTVALASQ
ncbi:B1065G12.14 [Oryza sativa Japonica Group]|uniref:Uncharacterized protein n=2 Tax=Oryza sativa subsp. japonica TaxID=39947 RepID=Q5N6Y1_ORYSJ|nr:B1065G12.14 [Oryza sativa Japonica Group]BAD82775.1 hypothetical protein [Oryza sativa Japonica Group]